jgi:putative membrane protein
MFTTIIATHHGWGGGPGPWLFPLFWLVPLTIGLVVWRFGRPHRSPSFEARSALATRYARGEVDDAEYRRRLEVLEGAGR